MSENKRVLRVLDDLRQLHASKSADYTDGENHYSNFEIAAKMAGTTPERVIMALIGMKVARLTELTSKGKEPNHESILDTKRDLAMYAVLLASLEDMYTP